jgi:hypothetical protein
LTHLSGFVSLNRDYLKPYDTVNAVVKSADGSHGIFELTFAAPTESRTKHGNAMIITGSSGWLSVNEATVQDETSQKSVIRTTIYSATETNGALGHETVEVIDEPVRGVEVELQSFFSAIKGNDDGLGEPTRALGDVAFIQAALNSEGQLIDLDKLISQL